MACEAWRTKIDAFADGELSAEETRAFSEHLGGCASCVRSVAGQIQWKRAVQHAGKRYAPRAEFRARVARSLAPAERRPAGLRARLPWVVAAAAVAFAVLVFAHRTLRSPRPQLFAELVDLHVATLASPNPVDVVSSDRHTVKPWFAGRIPFAFNPPAPENSPFTLLGGRVAYLDQAPGAELLYQVRKHKLSVLIFQDRPEFRRAFGSKDFIGDHLSFHLGTWSEGGLRYFIVTDASPEDVRELSAAFERAARP
jgi:anti-sigma factor RsiW